MCVVTLFTKMDKLDNSLRKITENRLSQKLNFLYMEKFYLKYQVMSMTVALCIFSMEELAQKRIY